MIARTTQEQLGGHGTTRGRFGQCRGLFRGPYDDAEDNVEDDSRTIWTIRGRFRDNLDDLM
eukprot:9120266-Lingulodinium_polyedra.AAC.1